MALRPIPPGLDLALRRIQVAGRAAFGEAHRATLSTSVGALFIDLLAGGSCALSAVITRLAPGGNRGRLIMQSSRLSLFRMFSHADIVALDVDGADLLLQRLVPAGASGAQVAASISDFLNSVEWWRDAIYQPD